jgi:ribose/xylose/arabinose/galactoside ABC-type transport system permease subunit
MASSDQPSPQAVPIPRHLDDPGARRGGAARFFRKTGIFWVLLLLLIIMSFVSPVFMTHRNMLNVMKQTSITGILGVGMTFVLISGGIDLSVGSIMAIAGVISASTAIAANGIPFAVTFATAIAVGILCGLVNGLGVAYITFPPFIMTLGMMTAAKGAALVYTNGRPIFGLSEAFVDVANGSWLGITNLIWFFVLVIVVGWFVLRKTVFGRHVYAIGGNRDAARLSGINVKRHLLMIYVISGMLAGLAGLLMCSRITSGNATIADRGYEMNAIAAAVIGGVSMNGGSGSVLGTLVGALILTIIQNSFDIMNINPFYQFIFQGTIILLAVFLDIRNKCKAI